MHTSHEINIFLNGMVKAKLKSEKNQAIEIELLCVLENVV